MTSSYLLRNSTTESGAAIAVPHIVIASIATNIGRPPRVAFGSGSGGYVRRFTVLSALAATVAVVGCRNDSRAPADGMTADLERDLQLAAAVRPQRSGVVSAIEQVANGGPSGTARGVRAAVHVRKRSPLESRSGAKQDVAAAHVAADVTAPRFAVGVTQTAAPTDIPDPVATSPSQGPSVGGSDGSYTGGSDEGSIGRGRGDDGRGRGPGGIGVIIRGGGAGDDHCEPQGPRRGTRNGGQTGGMGGIGGVIGGIIGGAGRFPVGRPTNFPRY